MPSSETCIYCGTQFDPSRGAGDHIIPVQLGEFRKDKRFRRICRQCNSDVGRSEQQMLRCGVESFLREVVQPNIPANRRRGRSPAKAAMGAPGPKFTIDVGDHRIAVSPSPEDPRDVFPVDQIVIHDEKGREHFVRLFPRMHANQLRKRLGKAGIVEQPKIWLHCDETRWEEYNRLIRAIWPKANMEKQSHTEPGVHPSPASIKLTVTDHYFRALAKIGFHYYLVHSRRRFRGDEPCFAPVRDFIMKGGEVDSFFKRPGPRFVMPFGDLPAGGGLTPKQWCHILAADESDDQATVYIQLFVGRGCIPRPHHIWLAPIGSKIVVPNFVWSHLYLYDDPQMAGRYAGRVEEADLTRLGVQ